MDWCGIAVFLYAAALTHFFGDTLSHRWKNAGFKTDGSVLLHCLLYTISFIPLFWWLDVHFGWLGLVFFSHLVIDRPAKKYIISLAKIFIKVREYDRITAFGLDQALHLLIPLIIAIFVF